MSYETVGFVIGLYCGLGMGYMGGALIYAVKHAFFSDKT